MTFFRRNLVAKLEKAAVIAARVNARSAQSANRGLCADLELNLASQMFYKFRGCQFAVLVCALCLAAGCATKAPSSAESPANSSLLPAPGIVTFDPRPVGVVWKVNPTRKFAVLRFPIGLMPAVGRELKVRRDGIEVGTLRVTGPQLDDGIVADIVSGECQPGDEAGAP